jgi:hypothetical protein
MAETNKNVDVLQSFIAQPSSLEQERAGKRFFLDSHSKVIPNEGNLLSLMTLKQFYQGRPEEAIFNKIAEEENRYLISAMNMLQEDKSSDAKALAIQTKLRSKFGSDFDSALSLAGLLKSKSDEKAFDELINPAITKLADTTLDRAKGIFQ